MPVEDSERLLSKAIAHVNRASELAREGYYEGADIHDSLANTYRGIAHELRVGISKRKYGDVKADEQLPYDMGIDRKNAPEPISTVTNLYRNSERAAFGFGEDTGFEPLAGDPGGAFRAAPEPDRIDFDAEGPSPEQRDADHEDTGDDAPDGGSITT